MFVCSILIASPFALPDAPPPAEPHTLEALADAAAAGAPVDPATGMAVQDETWEHHRGTYLRLSIGGVRTSDFDNGGHDFEFDTGFLAAVAIGQRVNSGTNKVGFDLELEGLWDTQDVDDNNVMPAFDQLNVGGLFLNGMFDFPIAASVGIYAGAGIGGAWVDPDTQNNFDADDGPFLAWQARAGLEWRFGGNTALDFGYRFINADDVELDQGGGVGASFDLETQQHVVELGLRFGL